MGNLFVRIIRPSSFEIPDLLGPRIDELRSKSVGVLYDELPVDKMWPFTSSSAEIRAEALMEALLEPNVDIVLCARGGYGASDILPLIDWRKLSKSKERLIVGFSDISAIHSAFYVKLGWSSLHAPMPATTLWNEDWIFDIPEVLNRGELNNLKICSKKSYDDSIEGKLFGGCFSVLTNLIGTEFFPKSLKDHILFLEDTGECAQRLMRYWNQWIQSSVLSGVKAIVLGDFRDSDFDQDELAEQFAFRCDVPVFKTDEFGHVNPNKILRIGALAKINNNNLIWNKT